MATTINHLWVVGRPRLEESLGVLALIGSAIVPLLEALLRWTVGTGIPASVVIAQHFTMWAGFLGASIAAREDLHLAIGTRHLIGTSSAVRVFTIAISTAVAAGLAWAGLEFVYSETQSITNIQGWLPLWAVQAIMPVAMALIAVHFARSAGGLVARLIAFSAASLTVTFIATAREAEPAIGAIGGGLVVLSALLGAPAFVAISGLALVLLLAEGVPVAAFAVESYRIITSPIIPTLAMFTLTGYLLAEGGASRRLVRLFRALFSWLPGGLVVVATLVCAFFTTFTGATGVTILALGGLLLPILRENGYSKRFAIGLLTASGSIGLMFPPSLPPILYGVVAHVSILDVYIAGLVPGLLLVGAAAGLGLYEAARIRAPRPAFDACEVILAVREAKWELLLPVLVLVGVFGGILTLQETAAATFAYALAVESLIHRELKLRPHLASIFIRSLILVGGIFMILSAALGLTNYLVDVEAPMRIAEGVRAIVDDRTSFLLMLNLLLLVVGCVMDIFSALAVIVPLILPAAQSFEIDPLHLGVIVLLNLELGYLTPPVGMNLFLAAYRFERSTLAIFRDVMPFVSVMAAVVLLVTFAPRLALFLVR